MWVNNIFKSSNSVILRSVVISLLLILAACSETIPLSSNKFVEKVEWNSQTKTLEINGHLRGDGSSISVSNADTEELLGKTLVTNQHYWKLDVTAPESIPCSVIVSGPTKSENVSVKNAPTDCNKQSFGSRAFIDSVGVTATPVRSVSSIAPDGIITSPESDLTVFAGSAVVFKGSANSQAGGVVRFLWNFDGAVPNMLVQNPGAVMFSKPGVYRVSLTVTDASGSDTVPATRVITVVSSDTTVQATAPLVNIDTPVAPQTILVGDSLFFAGSGFDPAGSGVLSYYWNFDGAVPDSNKQVPGLITFTQPGVFNISLTVTDSAGNRNLTPATIQVTVINLLATNLPPVGMIVGPSTDLTILKNSGLFFQGLGIDPDGNEPLSYYWSFGGAAPDSQLQNPGLIAFDVPGIYVVSLIVVDSLGMPDPNPPMRIIVVNDVAVNNNDFPEGTIVSPAADLQITAGDTVMFEGVGVSPTGNDPLTYLWDFGNPNIPESTEAAPGAMIFDVPGVYEITFTVTDSLGQEDPTPDVRIITVADPGAQVPDPTNPPPADTPPTVEMIEGEIISPLSNLTVDAGTIIDFEGMADDVAPGTTPFYFWNFGDPAIPDSMEQNPSGIIFNTPGEFTVTLQVGDDQGNIDPNPPKRIIIVLDSAGADVDPTPPGGADIDPAPANPGAGAGATPTPATLTPTGFIISPEADVTIAVGDSIVLIGAGQDPGGSTLTYMWDIESVGKSTEQIPGVITFTQVGIWEIELTVTNAEGVSDPNPPSITVTVQ